MFNDLIGKPFKDGGRGPNNYDCWGLACEVFKRYGIELPDYKIGCTQSELINKTYQEQSNQWIKVSGELSIPTLIVIRFNQVEFCNHVGVYVGGGRFIHARDKTGVCLESIDHPYWKQKIVGYYIPGWL